MDSFRFHEWLVYEIETNEGVIGIGNTALAPQIVKKQSTLSWIRRYKPINYSQSVVSRKNYEYQ